MSKVISVSDETKKKLDIERSKHEAKTGTGKRLTINEFIVYLLTLVQK